MSTLKYIFISLRPKQWIKNILIFAALIFSQNILNLHSLVLSMLGFIFFSITSGSVYILNDIIDYKKDKLHPQKNKRPIASNQLSREVAFVTFIIFTLIGLLFSFSLGFTFGLVVLSYLILQIIYSLLLKNVAILDIFVIAFGFVLRVVAGAELISVPISSWLLICTMFLSLFLALGKRRFELTTLDKIATTHRESLKEYSIILLDQMITVVTSSTVVAYALYALSPETISKFNTTNLKYSIPFVLYGIFRYLYLIYQKESGGSPEEILLTDLPLIINIILYAVTVWLILY
ncbi:MAG: decaprenyl-phosphate phosphoribosyltransferase [Candidatus Firestonebacteria bacterium]